MARALVAGFALVAIAATASAQDTPTPKPPAGSLTDVTGVWTMLVEGHQIGLELEQKDSKSKA